MEDYTSKMASANQELSTTDDLAAVFQTEHTTKATASGKGMQ